MNFMTVWRFSPENAGATIERFMETGGQPPEGINMLARWHDVAGGRGFAISEADDPILMAKWCRGWTDLMSFEVIPVLNDEQLAAALAG